MRPSGSHVIPVGMIDASIGNRVPANPGAEVILSAALKDFTCGANANTFGFTLVTIVSSADCPWPSDGAADDGSPSTVTIIVNGICSEDSSGSHESRFRRYSSGQDSSMALIDQPCGVESGLSVNRTTTGTSGRNGSFQAVAAE